jgi:hypothetical protein
MRAFVNDCSELKMPLIELFTQKSGGCLPFDESDIRLETLIMLNRFKGYKSSFYDAIPFSRGNRSIDDSFSGIADQLSDYREIDRVYQQYGLPNKKAMRKVIFENPGLLFYVWEIARLSLFNYDVLLQILKSASVYELLAFLHKRPEVFLFVEQMEREMGSVYTWRRVNDSVVKFMHDALDYYRVVEGRTGVYSIRRWHQNRSNSTALLPLDFNVPLIRKCHIPDEDFGEFSIVKLKNLAEYEAAAHDLANCLDSFGYEKPFKDRSVFCVKKGRSYIAAIEVRGDCIMQVGLYQNQGLDKDEELHSIYNEWVKRHGLSDCSVLGRM